jgi:hypothetical protein
VHGAGQQQAAVLIRLGAGVRDPFEHRPPGRIAVANPEPPLDDGLLRALPDARSVGPAAEQ